MMEKKPINLLKTKQPNLIFMDLQMPIKNGFEITQAIRALENETGTHTAIPIIGLSGMLS